MAYLLVFLGAGMGGAMRHGVNQFAAQLLGVAFPFGTLAINVAGSFAMGLLAEYLTLHGQLPQEGAAVPGDRRARRLHDLFRLLARRDQPL
ncbi:fluoride ion exporter CrcB/FEX [Sinorhizobium fredii]